MTQTIERVTDFNEIEDAIELWAATASGLPQLKDKTGFDLPKIYWKGFDNIRKRPYGIIQIIIDRSPGGSTKTKAFVDNKFVTTFSKSFVWVCQIQFFQDSFDENGLAIRETAERYAKNLADSYDLPSISKILTSKGIGFNPVSRNIKGDVFPNIDDDKFIHQASIDFMFNGINVITSKDTDYFTDIADPTITYYGDNI